MERKILTARIMNEKIKHKFTAEEIAVSYDIPVEDFYHTLTKLFGPSACADFSAQLKQNKKFRDKHPDFSPYATKGNIQSTDIPLDVSEPTTDTSGRDCCEITEDFSEVVNTFGESEIINESDANTDTVVPTLPELYDLLENTQNELDKVERAHTNVVSTRIQIRNALRTHQENFQKLLAQVCEEEKAVNELSEQLMQSEIEMGSLNFEIAKYRKNLTEIASEIERMQKITIFVYTNSGIEIDSTSAIDFPPEWDEIYKAIRDDEILEDFAVKQIKFLAKVITLCKQLKAENRTYEISFESPTLEEYFYSAIDNQG